MSKLVGIRYFQHPNEVVVLKTLLENAAISYFFKDENLTQTMPFYTFWSGGIQLQVWEEDVERATQLLVETGYLERDIEIPSQEERLEQYADRIPLVKNLKRRYKIIIAFLIILLMLLMIVF